MAIKQKKLGLEQRTKQLINLIKMISAHRILTFETLPPFRRG